MILTIDIGTTTVKCALFSSGEAHNDTTVELGSCVAMERTPVAAHHVNQETDPRLWSNALKAVIARLPQADKTVTACVVTGNGPTLIPCDAKGFPVGSALTWLDSRAHREAQEIAKRTGITVDASFPLPKALWLTREQPEVYENSNWLLSCAEWIVFRLTGRAHTAIGAKGFDRFYWSEDALAALDLDPVRFPPFAIAGEEIGLITKQASDEFGISANAHVYAGAADFQMALIGSATVDAGATLDRSGSSEGINFVSPASVNDPRLLSAPHLIPNLFNVGGVTSASGRALQWLAESGAPEPTAVKTAIERGAAAPAGARRSLFLPYLLGERTPHWNPQASAAFLGLTIRHDWNDMARAVLESVGFAIRAIIDILTENGCPVERMTTCGGPSRFGQWNQIKADITGVPVQTLVNPEADLVGCACVALAAEGYFEDLSGAAKALVRPGQEYQPDYSLSDLYGDLFNTYQRAGEVIQPLYDHLGG